jgi:hypothetical protein
MKNKIALKIKMIIKIITNGISNQILRIINNYKKYKIRNFNIKANKIKKILHI